VSWPPCGGRLRAFKVDWRRQSRLNSSACRRLCPFTPRCFSTCGQQCSSHIGALLPRLHVPQPAANQGCVTVCRALLCDMKHMLWH
jgi:hypothetical protein